MPTILIVLIYVHAVDDINEAINLEIILLPSQKWDESPGRLYSRRKYTTAEQIAFCV